MANFLNKAKSEGVLSAFFLCFLSKCKNPERIIVCILGQLKASFPPIVLKMVIDFNV